MCHTRGIHKRESKPLERMWLGEWQTLAALRNLNVLCKVAQVVFFFLLNQSWDLRKPFLSLSSTHGPYRGHSSTLYWKQGAIILRPRYISPLARLVNVRESTLWSSQWPVEVKTERVQPEVEDNWILLTKSPGHYKGVLGWPKVRAILNRANIWFWNYGLVPTGPLLRLGAWDRLQSSTSTEASLNEYSWPAQELPRWQATSSGRALS